MEKYRQKFIDLYTEISGGKVPDFENDMCSKGMYRMFLEGARFQKSLDDKEWEQLAEDVINLSKDATAMRKDFSI